jgi:3'-phosphoadenosine 5'-phosphosulfate sulfotransferase (PAPS reductase)/FAD synthetase
LGFKGGLLENLKVTKEELAYRQSLSLRDKIDLTYEKIESWHDHWDGLIYIAFSGGKDSTVLLNLVRNLFPEVPAMFSDTGLEYPEIRDFVKIVSNCEMVKPKMTFRQVIEKYGYPLVSKEQSQFIRKYRDTKSDYFKNILWNGNKWGMGKISEKWKFLVEAPFKIDDRCCDYLKKEPAKRYEKKTGRKAMVGSNVTEGFMRKTNYMRFGCNMYDIARPISMPLAFWNESDIWEYIHKYNIPYSPIYDMGYDRTGCMFCMFGVQREKEPNKFQLMAKTHPQLYKYCIENLGLGKVLDYIHVNYKN